MLCFDRDAGCWWIRCDGCLATLPDFIGTRDDVVSHITSDPFGWEMLDGDQCRCMACARRAR